MSRAESVASDWIADLEDPLAELDCSPEGEALLNIVPLSCSVLFYTHFKIKIQVLLLCSYC
jgi:hypothetical protein